jgi:hypothetical protein
MIAVSLGLSSMYRYLRLGNWSRLYSARQTGHSLVTPSVPFNTRALTKAILLRRILLFRRILCKNAYKCQTLGGKKILAYSTLDNFD